MPETRKIEKAETRSQDGGLRFQVTRYADGSGNWVRHGMFRAVYSDGTMASEGTYVHGLENGPWKDFHDNGKLAAEGAYRSGKEHGVWNYYGPEGKLEESIQYVDGVERGKGSRKKRRSG